MAKRYERADVRFNSGAGALLCNDCSKIIAYGFEHEDIKHYCGKCIVNHRPVTFVIEHDEKYDTYTLYSVVDTSFGGAAKNYVAHGSLEYVQGIQAKLALDELARIDQESMKYAIQVRWAPDDWLYVTKNGDEVQLFDTEKEAEEHRKIWNGGASRVVEYNPK